MATSTSHPTTKRDVLSRLNVSVALSASFAVLSTMVLRLTANTALLDSTTLGPFMYKPRVGVFGVERVFDIKCI